MAAADRNDFALIERLTGQKAFSEPPERPRLNRSKCDRFVIDVEFDDKMLVTIAHRDHLRCAAEPR
jgi:hypothetical protein